MADQNNSSANVHILSVRPTLRAAVTRMALGYPDILAKTISGAQVRHPGGTGHPLHLQDQPRVAANTAALFMANLFRYRAEMEMAGGNRNPAIATYFMNIKRILIQELEYQLGPRARVTTDSVQGRLLLDFERNLTGHIYAAFRLEMAQPQPDELNFWRMVILGLADVPDPSGVLMEAARHAFLDHESEFRRALERDAAWEPPADTPEIQGVLQ